MSDPDACLRDAILMQQLGVNTIRVYNVDNDLDHNQCASIFNAAGIYMILDVNSGLTGQYIDRTDPASTYTEAYLEHVFGVIEAFANFPNTLGFWAANENINQDSSDDAPAYVRAVVRDMKEYIANNIGRSIGVGYAAADVSTLLSATWNYLACDLTNSTDSKIDFFGLNDYEWCGDSSFTESGYNQLVAMFGDASVPVFFSEYGCNLVEPRTFTEVAALYGSEMTVMSGGLVYEWTEETNDYGLIDVNSSTEVTLLEDYNYLKLQLEAIDQTLYSSVNSTAESVSASTCNTASVTGTGFPSNFDLPAQPTGAASLISSGGLTSVSTGSLVEVTATTMPATVYNYTDSTVSNLKLVQLACNAMNAPGLVATYTSTSASCAYATTSPTGKTSSSSSSSSSGSGSSTSAASSVVPTSGPIFLTWSIATAFMVLAAAVCL